MFAISLILVLLISAAIEVALGITSFTQFSAGPVESKRRMSWVPVPTSMARIFTLRV